MLEINRRNARIWSMLGMRRVLGMALSELAEQDERFVFVTADVARYFGAEKFAQAYPDRYIDVGIAEQNMVTVAAGLAKEGYHPLTATYATFTTARALDQVRVSLAYMGLPVLLVGVGGGLAEGDLSATHMGLEDVAVMRVLPKLTVIEPADCAELLLALQALIREPRPAYLRLTGKTGQPMLYRNMFEYTIGKANCLQEGDGSLAFLTAGTVTAQVLKAAESLADAGTVHASVYDMHTIKPLDAALLEELSHCGRLVVVEEHMQSGGLAGAIAEFYAERPQRPRILALGVKDAYPAANDYEEMLRLSGLTAEGIASSVQRWMEAEQ